MNNELSNILGVSPSASTDEIHSAFRKKAREHHPDLGGDRQKFQQISAAYEELLKRKNSEKSSLAAQTSNSAEAAEANPYRSSPSPKREKRKPSTKESVPLSTELGRSARFLLTSKLPLQNQTTWFILVNALDIFVTYLHLRSGNYEANPIAAFFISKWNVFGMVVYKMSIVAIVCTIAQIAALKSLQKGTWLLNFGTAFIACVVIYSVWLFVR